MSKNSLTLGYFLQYSLDSRVVIELKDETAVEGILSNCDSKTLNIELIDAVLYRRRTQSPPLRSPSIFVKGRNIRFIHFEDYPVF
uniref:Sm domain-containing protein n=1 Tax=Ditylenchus dipsaci TaxID=166011 RepID=A0A915D5N5_9BILA